MAHLIPNLSRIKTKTRIDRVRKFSRDLSALSEDAFRDRVLELKRTIQQSESPEKHVEEAFGMLDAAAQRVAGMSAYDVQLTAAIALTERRIVEMATGEGKTLTALFPVFFRALQGRGVLLATANDYLAQRDAEFAIPIYAAMGISVGVVTDGVSDEDRRIAYREDVTYGTASQFGFDFLKDRAKVRFNQNNPTLRPEAPVQRRRLFAIVVDEVDSLLIDEAATPLIISSAPPEIPDYELNAYVWASKLAPGAIEGQHYRYFKIEKKAELTNRGRMWVLESLKSEPKNALSLVDLYEFVERAINVHRDQFRDRNYLITDDGEIQLVDQGTGRVSKGRQMSEGIHQAIQAKEGLPITAPSGFLAKVTLQGFFLGFEKLSGMTGTAKDSKAEFKKIYQLSISQVPTHRKCLRREMKTRCFAKTEQWLSEIENECRDLVAAGRSVLIGARNIKYSELISAHLASSGLENRLLNARQDAREAEIVGQAGERGRITVATSMAGRGTDIKLEDSVQQSGGLHIILAGIHESRRVDRQLLGRSARQGEPGSYRVMLCLDDDLLDEAFSTSVAHGIREKLNERFNESECLATFRKAQQVVSKRSEVSRKTLFHNEKKQLKHLSRAGMDPLLDFPS